MREKNKSTDSETSKIKRLLEVNGIEVSLCYDSINNTAHSKINSERNQKPILEDKEINYIKQEKILKVKYRNKNLINDELIQQFDQIKYMHYFISHQITGTPKIFAKKIGMSQKQMFVKLKFFKNLNALIKYDVKNKTFFYKESFELIFQLSLLTISNESILEILCSSEDDTEIITSNKSLYI